MRHKYPVATVVLTALLSLFSACQSNQGKTSLGLPGQLRTFRDFSWDSYPIDDSAVFFSASDRLLNREKEVDICLERAAAQAAQFYTVDCTAKLVKKRTGRLAGAWENIELQWDRELEEKLKNELELIRVVQYNTGTYAIARLRNARIEGLPRGLRDEIGRLEWVYNPPKIHGFYSVVGVAQRSRNFADSVQSADRNAMAELVRLVASDVKSKQYVKSGADAILLRETSYEVASATITGFYVLHRWIPEDGDYFYSLAICRSIDKRESNQL